MRYKVIKENGEIMGVYDSKWLAENVVEFQNEHGLHSAKIVEIKEPISRYDRFLNTINHPITKLANEIWISAMHSFEFIAWLFGYRNRYVLSPKDINKTMLNIEGGIKSPERNRCPRCHEHKKSHQLNSLVGCDCGAVHLYGEGGIDKFWHPHHKFKIHPYLYLMFQRARGWVEIRYDILPVKGKIEGSKHTYKMSVSSTKRLKPKEDISYKYGGQIQKIKE